MNERPYTQFYANFLGGFSLYIDNEEVQLPARLQTKYMQILLILLKAGAEGVERRKLISFLRPDETDMAKGLNNLRQQVFLLRRVLRQAGLPQKKYIVPHNSRYYFSDEDRVESDTGCLDRLAYRIRNETLDEEEKKKLLLQFCQKYSGPFLPMLDGEEWVVMESGHYQKLYFSFLSSLCDILKKQGETEKMLELCTRASEIHPYDEWQAVQIDCLMSLNRYKEALKVYEKAVDTFYEDLGITSLDRVMAKYRNVSGQLYYTASALTGIKAALQEPEEPTGAYFCSYPNFLDLYHVMNRIGERTGMSITLMICTMNYPLEDAKENAADRRESLDRMMERFRGVLLCGIRAEDVYTRYSENQFLVMLLGANEENGRMIAKRLENSWQKAGGNGKTGIEFTVQQADGPQIRKCEDGEKGNLHCSYHQSGKLHLAGTGHLAEG